ncbi:MAG: hypothetical protein ACEQSX_10625 [Baekduiaceae bacterium]
MPGAVRGRCWRSCRRKLFFRRSQLSRRLLGGIGDSTDRVAGELLAA